MFERTSNLKKTEFEDHEVKLVQVLGVELVASWSFVCQKYECSLAIRLFLISFRVLENVEGHVRDLAFLISTWVRVWKDGVGGPYILIWCFDSVSKQFQ